MSRCFVYTSVCAAGAIALAAGAAPAGANETVTFPLSCAVATVDRAPVVDEAWLDARVEQANRIFAGPGIRFSRTEARTIDARYADLESRRDRHALGREMRPSVINCFVVQTLRDVDDPERYRMGVHWRPLATPGAHFVIITASSSPSTLAHELGHFFGNRAHPPTPGNIMSYSRGTGLPFFDAEQTRRIGRFARRFQRVGELSAVAPATTAME